MTSMFWTVKDQVVSYVKNFFKECLNLLETMSKIDEEMDENALSIVQSCFAHEVLMDVIEEIIVKGLLLKLESF